MTITCGIFLISKTQRILIGASNQNQWSVPKGKCEIGETYLNAALRELYEEANIRLDKNLYTFMELPPIKYKKANKILHGFAVIGVDEDSFKDIKCNSFTDKNYPELHNHQWETLKIAQMLLHPAQAEAIEYINKIK